MPSPLTVKRNDYRAHPKRSDVYTPVGVARFLFDILYNSLSYNVVRHPQFKSVFDPAIGTGRLTDPWYEAGCRVIGCDIAIDPNLRAHEVYQGRFETLDFTGERPDVVLANPPFNGCEGKRLYPEVFLERAFDLFGVHHPVVLFAPMGMRLNQRRKSTRWRWLRDCGAQLTSIVSLPLDVFSGVEFHAEVLMFNVQGVRPHYFLPETAL
jgi:hypothetical protein